MAKPRVLEEICRPMSDNWTVTVFGGSRVHPGDPRYEEAYRLGRLLAEHGFVLCNGGYNGTMEAAARGAKEAGGKTIGVTLKLFAPLKANHWVDEEVLMPDLFRRLEKLWSCGDAFVVLHGGIGTLLELALVWNLAQVPSIPRKPILVVGQEWTRTLDAMREHLAVRDLDRAVLTLVPNVEEAVTELVKWRAGVLASR